MRSTTYQVWLEFLFFGQLSRKLVYVTSDYGDAHRYARRNGGVVV